MNSKPPSETRDLFERILRCEKEAEHQYGGDVLVPVDHLPIFRVLAEEICKLMAEERSAGVLVIVDGATAAQTESLGRLRTAADQVVVIGENGFEWGGKNKVTVCPTAENITPQDRFLVVFSSSIALAVLGEEREGDDGAQTFHGGWSALRSCVRRIAQALLDAAGVDPPESFGQKPEVGAQTRAAASAMHLMALVTRRLESLQNDVVMDKNELASVLDILKAISANRGTHELFLQFVQHIADVITTNRCTIVSISADAQEGHVLASHEDPSVRDIRIDLSKYPELKHALETREKVVINDVWHHPLTEGFTEYLKVTRFRSLIVVPIVLFDDDVGTLLLRAARRIGSFEQREISFCEVVAEAAANALERAHLLESLTQANERLEHLAVTDGLTGIYNHRYFRERLEDEYERAIRYEVPLSCMIFDIDDFKLFNDTFGHVQGDSILREIAGRTSDTVRKTDVVARYGGEEFIVIMPQTEIEGAMAEAMRLQQELSTKPYPGLPEGTQVTVSMGVAVLDGDTMKECEDLIRVADKGLYEAKAGGKNRVVAASGDGAEPA